MTRPLTFDGIGTLTATGATLQLPPDAATQGFAILARRRSGKSMLAGVMEEHFCAAGIPWVCFDPVRAHWGIRYRDRRGQPGGSSGYDVLIVGGPHGDVPLDPQAGAELAQILVDTDISCVVDLRDEDDADRQTFVAAFAQELLKINDSPRHIIFEEAHEMVPQQLWEKGSKAAQRCRSAVSRLIRNGGGQGIGFTLVSQRPAEVSKSVLEQIDNLFILRMSGPNDIGAVKGWFEHNVGDKEQLNKILSSLPALKPEKGEAWLCSPTWLHEIVRVNVRKRVTYHAGATPKAGQKLARPKRIDVPAITARFREAADEREISVQEEVDLKKRVKELEIALVAKEAAAGSVDVAKATAAVREANAKVIEASEQADELRGQLTTLKVAAAQAVRHVSARAGSLTEQTSRTTEALEKVAGDLERAIEVETPVTPQRPQRAAPMPKASPPSPSHPVTPVTLEHHDSGESEGNSTVTPAKQGILDALAKALTAGLPQLERHALAAWSGKKYSGGFRNYISSLKTMGLIHYPSSGDVALTPAGVDQAAPVHAPPTLEDVHSMWRSILTPAQAEILDALINVYPHDMERLEIAEVVGKQYSGGFRNYISRLKTVGAIEYPSSGRLKASELLFPIAVSGGIMR